MVLEVGLGGRLDATNVVDADVAVLTGVALDHTEMLGPTLADIAREKAGIAKPGKPVVIGDDILENEVRARGAEVLRAGVLPTDTLGLAGAHQRRNAALALRAVEALGVTLAPEVAARALRDVTWPGRLERIGDVLFDCAHNPDAARALAEALPAEPFVAVAAVSAEKDAAGVLAPIAARASLLIVTQAASPRALACAELARAAPPGARVVAEPVPERALARARETGLPIVVFGSIFLVGALRAHLRGEEIDRFDQDPMSRPRVTSP